VKGFLVPINIALLACGVVHISIGLALNALFFWMMLAFAFSRKGQTTPWIGMMGFLLSIICLALVPFVNVGAGVDMKGMKFLEVVTMNYPDSAGLSIWILAGLAAAVGICSVIFPKITGIVTGSAGLFCLGTGFVWLANQTDAGLNVYAFWLLAGMLALLAQGLIGIFKSKATRPDPRL
jgi:hypothetical protein